MSKRILGNLGVLLLGAGLGIACIVGGWIVYQRMTTGEWKTPKGALVRISSPGRTPTKIAKTIYLHRGAITLLPGEDDAAENRSSIVKSTGRTSVSMKGFTGSNSLWTRIVQCVNATFSPLDVTITDERPADPNYIMVVVGGQSRDIGFESHHVGGLAPFNGEVIPKAIVFAFSKALRNDRRAICNTIAMEVGHAYGLDHAYDCSDVMTYLPDCGPKYFQNKEVPCGEHKRRPCPQDRPTQNSFAHLEALLGVRPGQAEKATPGTR